MIVVVAYCGSEGEKLGGVPGEIITTVLHALGDKSLRADHQESEEVESATQEEARHCEGKHSV